MDYEVGQMVRIKPKEWFDKYGYDSSDKELVDLCGKEAKITEIKDESYSISINIGPKDLRWMECCFEPIEESEKQNSSDNNTQENSKETNNMEANKITINGINVPKGTEIKTYIDDGHVVITFSQKESEMKELAIKNGDVLRILYYGAPCIAIINRIEDDSVYIYACLNLNDNILTELSTSGDRFLIGKHASLFEPASISDFRRLQKELAIQKLHWDTETLKFEKYRFRAEKGGKYFYITDDGCIIEDTDDYTGKHHTRYHFGNYFETKEIAINAKSEVRSKLISL